MTDLRVVSWCNDAAIKIKCRLLWLSSDDHREQGGATPRTSESFSHVLHSGLYLHHLQDSKKFNEHWRLKARKHLYLRLVLVASKILLLTWRGTGRMNDRDSVMTWLCWCGVLVWCRGYDQSDISANVSPPRNLRSAQHWARPGEMPSNKTMRNHLNIVAWSRRAADSWQRHGQ